MNDIKITFNIVFDTNIFIEHLTLVENLIKDKFPYDHTLIVPFIVLNELDGLKKEKRARDAIRFIKKSDKFIHINKNDIELDSKLTNDDKIVEISSRLPNCILITGDVVMSIKSKYKNFKTILVNFKDYFQLRNQIMTLLGYESMDICEENTTGKNYIFDKGREILIDVIVNEYYKKLGTVYDYFLNEKVRNLDFVSLVNKAVNDNVFDFTKYEKECILKFAKKIDKCDFEELKSRIRKILILFRAGINDLK